MKLRKENANYPLVLIFILGLIGVLLASFLTITHYTGVPGAACPKHQDGVPVCDIVNQSIYSELFGIPIALFAIFVYSAYSLTSYFLLTKKKFEHINPLHLYKGLIVLSGASLLFAIYLVSVLYFILKTVCLYCFIAHAITLIIFVLSVVAFFKAK